MKIWNDDMTQWLLVLRDVLGYEFGDCADNIKREYGVSVNRNGCVSAYHRAKVRGQSVPEDIRNEINQNMV